MKKTLKKNILYFEEGECKYKYVEISFISNGVIKDYNSLIKYQIDYKEKIKKYQEAKEEKEKKEIISFVSKVNEYSNFDVLKRILEENKVKDEQLTSKDFWYKQVDFVYMNNFIYDCIFKDIDEEEKKKEKYTFHEDRLIIALNKYWRPIDEDYYLNKMDIPDTNQAIQVSQFPEHVQKWIWEKEKKIELFDFFKNYKLGG